MSLKAPPSLRLHRPSRQGVVTLCGCDHYLGHWPASSKKPPAEVRDAYDAIVAEWLANGRQLASRTNTPLTVAELILMFWERHVVIHYRHPDGSPTSEQENYKLSLRPLRRLFGKLPSSEFSPLKLKAIRQSLIDTAISRGVINQRIGRIKRLFKWAVAEELVPETVYRGLLAVEGLKAGRSEAKETERVTPVPDEHVEALLPHLPSPVRAMVQIQRLTGMRPGEVALMRACDIDMIADTWIYRPVRHKTAWRGKERAILIGPRCQEVLRPFLTTMPSAYLFRPADARKERYAAMRAARKSSVQPSQLCRRKLAPKREVPEYFDRHAYAGVVARACKKTGVPHWHPNKLRHSKATEVRAVYGLEGAQVVLGHTRANVTEVYAERNMALAAKVAVETG